MLYEYEFIKLLKNIWILTTQLLAAFTLEDRSLPGLLATQRAVTFEN